MYTATTQRIDNKDTLSLRPLTDENASRKREFLLQIVNALNGSLTQQPT